MMNLFEITRQVAQFCLPHMIGEATDGTTTSLTDTTRLRQPASTWTGTLWMLSGDHAGKFFGITSFASGKVVISETLATPIAVGDRYLVTGPAVPFEMIRGAVNQALETFQVEATDTSLEGDGTTLQFARPSGVERIIDIKAQGQAASDVQRFSRNHWREEAGYIWFSNLHPPRDGYTLTITHISPHAELVDYDDEINYAVRSSWLKWTACFNLLTTMYTIYGDDSKYRIPTLLEISMKNREGQRPRIRPIVIVRTA